MQMVVSYKDQYLDHHHHLDQEKQHLYHFLQDLKKKRIEFILNKNSNELSSVISGIDVPERLSDVVDSTSKFIAFIFNEQSIAALSVKYRSCR
jgi:hypothetical protein